MIYKLISWWNTEIMSLFQTNSSYLSKFVNDLWIETRCSAYPLWFNGRSVLGMRRTQPKGVSNTNSSAPGPVTAPFWYCLLFLHVFLGTQNAACKVCKATTSSSMSNLFKFCLSVWFLMWSTLSTTYNIFWGVRFSRLNFPLFILLPSTRSAVHHEPWPLLWLFSTGSDPVTFASNFWHSLSSNLVQLNPST